MATRTTRTASLVRFLPISRNVSIIFRDGPTCGTLYHTQQRHLTEAHRRKLWRIKGLQELMIRFLSARAGQDASCMAVFVGVILWNAWASSALGQVTAEQAEQETQQADAEAEGANTPADREATNVEPAEGGTADAVQAALGDGRLIR